MVRGKAVKDKRMLGMKPEIELEMLYRNQRISLAISVCLAMLVFSALWGRVARNMLLMWLMAMLLVSVFRFAGGEIYLKFKKKFTAGFWHKLFFSGAWAAALCWGWLPWMVPGERQGAMQFIALNLAGVTAFATVSLSPSFRVLSVFLATVLLPLFWRILAQGSGVSAYSASSVLLYMLVMLLVSNYLKKIIFEARRLDEENSELSLSLDYLKSLRKENAMFRNMVEMAEGMAIMVHKIDDAGRVEYANSTACRHFGMERQALLGTNAFDWDVVVDEKLYSELREKTKRNGSFQFETRHRHSSGREIAASVLISRFNYEGETYGVSFTRELLPEIQSEKERKELDSLRYLSSFESSIPGFLFACSMRKGRLAVTYASSAVYEVHGVNAARVIAEAETWWESVHPSDRKSLHAAFVQSAGNMEVLDADYRISHPEKGECWVRMRAVPQRKEDATLWHGFAYDITRSKEVYEAMLSAQMRWKFALEGSGLGVWDWNKLTGEVRYSSVYKEMLGYADEEFPDRVEEWENRVHPDDLSFVIEKHLAHDRGETLSYEAEFRMRCKDGSWKWIHSRGMVAERDSSGTPLRMIGIHADISAKKQIEDTLFFIADPGNISAGFLQALVRFLGEKLCVDYVLIDQLAEEEGMAETVALYAQGRIEPNFVYELKGTPCDNVIGKRVCCYPQGVKALFPQDSLLAEMGIESYAGIPLWDSKGKPIGLIAIMDSCPITEQALYVQTLQLVAPSATAELERCRDNRILKKREQEFRSLVENLPDPFFRYDRDLRRTYVSRTVEKFTGTSAHELLGKTPIELPIAQGKQNELLVRSLTEVLETGRVVEVEIEAEDRDGKKHYLANRLGPEFGEDGNVIAVISVLRDITLHRELEQRLAEREQEFRSLVENTMDTVSRYDRNCRRIYANPALQASVGLRADMLIGSSPAQFPGGDRAALYENRIREVFEAGVSADIELSWPGLNGKEEFSLVRLTPEFGADGEVQSVLAVGRDITELVEYREKIHDLAFFDLVTGLANRALFNDRLNQAILDASRHDALFGVMLLDLDRFKSVNDTMGHQVGDSLLREVAGRLTQCLRGYDTVSRLGGDEFAVLVPEIRDLQCAGGIAEKMLKALTAPFCIGGKDIFIGISIGIALYPADSCEAESLLKYADLAMYSAKHSGGNCFRYYSPDLTLRAQDRLLIETEMRRALERQEFELHFQPKFDISAGTLVGSEALLRWNSGKFGQVAPDRFIGIAEDTGMILEIGEWVLIEACKAARSWNFADRPLHKVAVNLSPRQFHSGDLLDTISGVLQSTGCKADWIELEITESLLLDNSGNVRDTLSGLRAMGCSIALDDFGTGYSSLSYLTDFPIDTLKIDRSFISDMLTKHPKSELVKAIIAMAECLNMGVVAEGVETGGQADFLLENGCRFAQGFLYGRPVPGYAMSFFGVAAGNFER